MDPESGAMGVLNEALEMQSFRCSGLDDKRVYGVPESDFFSGYALIVIIEDVGA